MPTEMSQSFKEYMSQTIGESLSDIDGVYDDDGPYNTLIQEMQRRFDTGELRETKFDEQDNVIGEVGNASEVIAMISEGMEKLEPEKRLEYGKDELEKLSVMSLDKLQDEIAKRKRNFLIQKAVWQIHCALLNHKLKQ